MKILVGTNPGLTDTMDHGQANMARQGKPWNITSGANKPWTRLILGRKRLRPTDTGQKERYLQILDRAKA
jgi:hypothetical protein